MNFEFIGTERSPIKAWTKGVQLEDAALNQLKNIAGLPFIHKHVAVMPDVHWGMGATVGSVIATKGAIIPAAVGVDIGCGLAGHTYKDIAPLFKDAMNVENVFLPLNFWRVLKCT